MKFQLLYFRGRKIIAPGETEMKLATFSVHGGADELGVIAGERIVSLTRAAPMLPATMTGLIAKWDMLARDVTQIAREAMYAHDLRAVHLKAPVPRPGKIMAIGLNYADHIRETGAQTPKDQTWFCKQPTAVNGPFDPIQIPKVSHMVDWEAELVVIVGKGGRHIPRETARSHVFGYACGNDVSVRDWQKRTPQWIIGKGFDTHAPFGPWITTADEAGDPHTLGITCVVNGETRQSSNTCNLVFKVEDQLALLSQAMTLEPGDIIFTGTPGGVGMAMSPPVWLKPGDTCRVEIEKLGAIEAVCEAEK
jgi:2-keto-4-pentenoate hydratase/2-oxohepta-3-ene-1,7-dioic acid hydratase in catechol pathway